MSTFPFCCSQQRPAGTNGLLSVSLGSGEQFVSIKQDHPHLPRPTPLPPGLTQVRAFVLQVRPRQPVGFI